MGDVAFALIVESYFRRIASDIQLIPLVCSYCEFLPYMYVYIVDGLEVSNNIRNGWFEEERRKGYTVQTVGI